MNYVTYAQEVMLFGLAIILVRLDPSIFAGKMRDVRYVHESLSCLPTFDGRYGVDFETIKDIFNDPDIRSMLKKFCQFAYTRSARVDDIRSAVIDWHPEILSGTLIQYPIFVVFYLPSAGVTRGNDDALSKAVLLTRQQLCAQLASWGTCRDRFVVISDIPMPSSMKVRTASRTATVETCITATAPTSLPSSETSVVIAPGSRVDNIARMITEDLGDDDTVALFKKLLHVAMPAAIGSSSLLTLEVCNPPQLSIQGSAMVGVVSNAMMGEREHMYREYNCLGLTTGKVYLKNSATGIPSIDTRIELMEKCMPVTTVIQLSQLQSKNSVETQRALQNKIATGDLQGVDYLVGEQGIDPAVGKERQYREYKKSSEKHEGHEVERKRKAVLLIEVTMGMASQKHSLSPTLISTGVRLVWGGTCRLVHQSLCNDGLACSPRVAAGVIDALVKDYEASDAQRLKEAIHSGGRKMIVTWVDNKAFLGWLKEKGIQEDFTKIVYTITELHKVVDKNDPPTSDAPAFPSLDVSLFAQLVVTGVTVHASLRYITGTDHDYQGLRNVDAGRSMMAKSSSYHDVKSFVVNDRFGRGFGMDKTEIMGVMDGEFLVHLMKLALHDPPATKNLFVSQALWHVKAHTVKNIFMDRTYQLLLIIPFMTDCMDMQAKKKLEQRDDWLARMRPFGNKSAPPAAVKNPNSKRKPVDDEPSMHFTMMIRNHAAPDDTSALILERIGEESPEKDDDAIEMAPYDEGVRLAEDELPKALRKNLHPASFLSDMVRVVHGFCSNPDGRAKGALYNYNQFRTEGAMNYARQEYLTELLTLAGMQAMPDLEYIAEVNNSWPVRMVVDLIQNGFEALCVQPTRNIILNGSAQLFIETLHHYVALMAHYQRFKVCKGMFLSVMSAHHMTTARLDLGKFYFQHATLGNDLITELGNAAATSMISTNSSLPTPTEAEQLLIQFQAKRHFLQAVNQSRGKQASSSSKGRGEVVRQQMRVFEAACAKRDLPVVTAWLLDYCRRLAETNLQGDLQGVDSIDGMLSNGRLQMEQKVNPELEAYMRKERRVAAIETAARSGDMTAIYKCYLHMFTNSILQLALLANSAAFSYTKEILVEKVAATYTKEEFNSYFVDNNLCNEDRIAQKMEELKLLRSNGYKK